MRKIKLKSQPKWIVRMMFGIGAVAGLLLAFHTHPIGGTNAQSIDCPAGQYLATGDVCVTNDKDIVIQATATAANQTLKINKYFANDYTVDRGDGSTGNLTSDTTHTYSTEGTYNITLSLTGGASRWTFIQSSNQKPLVPTNGTTVTGVQITYMPSLAEGFGDSATNPGNNFFSSFNRDGALTSLPEGSFDTSKITTVENSFFYRFNYGGALTSLPEGSFDTENIITVGNNFFSSFNSNGSLTSLPAGSFDTSNISGSVGSSFFSYFNSNGKLTSLPEGSFDTSKITTVGGGFFNGFNRNGSLTSLPEGSFDTSNISGSVGGFFRSFNEDGSLTSLPEGSFNTSKITTVGDYFFASFNEHGSLTSLPEGSFDTSNISGTVGNEFFAYFNYQGALTSLPEGSFDTSKITTVRTYFFARFNYQGALTSLPEGSFDTSNISGLVGDYFFTSFNGNGSLTSLPEGSFDTSKITTVRTYFFARFNGNGSLTSLPEGSFDTSNISGTVKAYFFDSFNYNGSLTSLPESFKLNSLAYNVSSGYLNAFNSPNYTLNRNVSDLVSGVRAPNSDRNTFSDNQPGRCGVDPNWLVNEPICKFDVMFYDGGIELTSLTISSVDYGSGIILPEAPEKTGYVFTGWYKESTFENEWNEGVDVVTGATTLYAKYICDTHYHLEDGVCTENTKTVSCRESGAPEHSSYIPGDVEVARDSGTQTRGIAENCAWSCDTHYHTGTNGDTCEIDIFQITWKDGDAVIYTGLVPYGEMPNYIPTKDGYNFLGREPEVQTVTGDVEYTAVWTPEIDVNGNNIADQEESFTVTWKDGDTVISTGLVDYGELPSFTPTKDGYNFAGWIPAVQNVTGDVEYRATWTAKQTPRPSSGGGGGGGGTTLRKDRCPGGDYSDSYYDGTCDASSSGATSEGSNKDSSAMPQNDSKGASGATNKSSGTEGEGSNKDSSATPQNDGQTPQNDKTGHNSADDFQYDTTKFNPKYSDEMNQAYQYAYHYGITTKDTIRNADMNGKLTRIAMAKMLSQYAIKVLGMNPDKTRINQFDDVSEKLDSDYDNGVTLAYQLGIMGINMPNNEFLPYNYVTRAQFVTALSRLLYKTKDGTDKYYSTHMVKLYNEGIITNMDPTMLERRGYVMLMLMRSAENGRE